MRDVLSTRNARWWAGCACVGLLAASGCGSATNAEAVRAEQIDRLATTVVETQDDAQRTAAIDELKSMGAASGPALRRAFQQSPDTVTRIEVAEAIAKTFTVEAVPDLIDALDEGDVELRAASNDALQSLMGGVSVRYDPAAPAEQRRAAIERWRSYWDRRNTPEMNAIGSDNQKAKKAMREQTIFE